MELSQASAPPAARAGFLPRWNALAWVGRHERAVRIGLDVLGILVIFLTFLSVGHPDLNFHIVWVLLAAHAFLFGLRSTMLRIGVATAALVLFYLAGEAGLIGDSLDLIEWPLMFVIAVFVAVMAEWRNAAGRHYAALYRLASDRLLTAHETERRRLAMDLHDGVGQTLTALGLALEAVATAPNGTREDLVSSARDMLAGAIAEMRDVAERLQPVRMASIGLPAAIRDLGDHAGVPVSLEVQSGTAAARALPPETAVQAFRIVQEALNNAIRHGRPGKVSVVLARRGRLLELVINDDGRGYRAGNITLGLGLAGMHERAAMIGAELRVTSAPGKGTTVRLAIPLADAPPDAGELGEHPDGARERAMREGVAP